MCCVNRFLHVIGKELLKFIVPPKIAQRLFKRAGVTYSLSRTLLMSLQGCTYVILYELATCTLHARRHHQA